MNYNISEWDRRKTPASRLFHKWFNKLWEWSEHIKCWTALDVQGFVLSIINKESLLQYSLQEDNWPQTALAFILSCSLCLYSVNSSHILPKWTSTMSYLSERNTHLAQLWTNNDFICPKWNTSNRMIVCNSIKESWSLTAIFSLLNYIKRFARKY